MDKELQTTRNIQEVSIANNKTGKKITWINVTNAGKKEIEFLRKKYGFTINHLQQASYSVSSQRPKIYNEADYLFVILHFPIFVENTITSTEVDFFIGHGYLITVHNGNLPALNEFFSLCKKDGDSLLTYQLESAAILTYELLNKLIHSCFPLLDKNSLAITRAQEMIFQQDPRRAVTEILQLRHNVINFHKIMHAHKKIITKMMEMKSRIVPPKQIERYYKKLIDHTINIWEILENQKEVIEILNSTNESLLNYRLSEIMKTLTIFSIISFYLTLIAATFSMRAEGMPIVNHPYGFVIIISFMAITSAGIVLIFKRKKWL